VKKLTINNLDCLMPGPKTVRMLLRKGNLKSFPGKC
jgi:hypothetical protein